jgi:hypothetical protein
MGSDFVKFVHIGLQNWIERNFSLKRFKIQISAQIHTIDITLQVDGNVLSYLIVNNRTIVREVEE